MRKGKALRQGDTIGVLAASSPCPPEVVQKAKAELEALGFRVKLSETCWEDLGGFLAGTPQHRACELEAMFTDPEVDAILCLRGGYGSPQILPLLDYECIAKHPKLFIGYSDVTALHTALGQCSNLATLHGPMASIGWITGVDPFSREYLHRAITSADPLGQIVNPPGEEMMCLVGGEASGPIVGGNLSLIASLMGTPYELDTRGKILFIEDVGEEPYRIDRMLTQLSLAGKFADASGILIGTWADCSPDKYPDGFDVLDVVKAIVTPYQKPTIWNVQAGHGEYNIALPFGVQSYMNASTCTVIIEESLVNDDE
ncbi:S66 peptidase family protein [Brevibacillus ginsengisoli]|uniref:S66 peptidase family protein n=1 Tax=Brevibacillus ginsengisoli TaxID=363854 RepID=UPI003CF1FF0E